MALAKSPGALVVWRHNKCGKPVAVVTDGAVRELNTYFRRRFMLGVDREGVDVGVAGEKLTIVGQIAPPVPTHVRCCGAPWQVSWAELWKDAEQAKQEGARVKKDIGTATIG